MTDENRNGQQWPSEARQRLADEDALSGHLNEETEQTTMEILKDALRMYSERPQRLLGDVIGLASLALTIYLIALLGAGFGGL